MEWGAVSIHRLNIMLYAEMLYIAKEFDLQ